MKKPEEYLEEHVVAPDENPDDPRLDSMEQEFIKKYLTGEETLEISQTQEPATAFSFEEQPATAPSGESGSGTSESGGKGSGEQETYLDRTEEKEDAREIPEAEQAENAAAKDGQDIESRERVQLVGFYLQNQEYTIPISDVKEVIKRVEPTELPESPEYLVGVVNLKGKVTPLINLAYLLGKTDFDTSNCGFIIVGFYQDLQIGVMVDRITTMHNIEQKDIDWTLDPYLTGGGIEFLSGLIRGEHLIGIISIKEIVNKIMQ